MEKMNGEMWQVTKEMGKNAQKRELLSAGLGCQGEESDEDLGVCTINAKAHTVHPPPRCGGCTVACTYIFLLFTLHILILFLGK